MGGNKKSKISPPENLTSRELLIKELATITNFSDDIDIAVFKFTTLCIANLYKIKDPQEVIDHNNPKTRGPRACLYYLLWLTTGRSYTELNELNPIYANDSSICRMVNNIRSAMKNEKSPTSINIRNILVRIEKFKELTIKKWHSQEEEQ